VHVIADTLDDLTSLLDLLSDSDEICEPLPRFNAPSDAVRVMPKGRNFH